MIQKIIGLRPGQYLSSLRSYNALLHVLEISLAYIAGGSDYVVRKTGDDKGVKSSALGARKDLEQYVNDCAPLAEQMKNGTVDKKVSVETIAEMYSTCQ